MRLYDSLKAELQGVHPAADKNEKAGMIKFSISPQGLDVNFYSCTHRFIKNKENK